MHGLLRCNINTGVHESGRNGRVTQRCHNSPDGNGATECGWRHAPEAHGGYGGFWKSQLIELSSASGEDGWLLWARWGLGQVSHEMGGGRWKSQNRKNVYLSPYVEEPLNSKVIKSLVPELRSRKCFRVSIFTCSMYICYEQSMFVNASSAFPYSILCIIIFSLLGVFHASVRRWFFIEVWVTASILKSLRLFLVF